MKFTGRITSVSKERTPDGEVLTAKVAVARASTGEELGVLSLPVQKSHADRYALDVDFELEGTLPLA